MHSYVSIDASPRSEVACASLLTTDNKLFNKVIIVFAFLCDEASALTEHVQMLLPALLLLAEPPKVGSEPARPEAFAAGALPLLFSVQQFVSRANSLSINLVHQIASLYEPRQRLFVSTFRTITMRRAFDALGDLFGVLIAVDDALLRATHLPGALDAYRRVVANMLVEPKCYGMSRGQLQQLEGRLLALDADLVRGVSFRKCITQSFDVPNQLAVSTNVPFLGQLAENIKRLHAELAAYIGQPTETNERNELPKMIGLFCFHAFLSSAGPRNSAVLDRRMYSLIWALCKRAPLVHLSGVAVWRPLQFLSRVLPMKSSSMSVDSASKIEVRPRLCSFRNSLSPLLV